LLTSIETGRDPEVGADAGLAVMRLVDETYAAAKTSAAPALASSTP
jgi:hypothetical protein